MATNDEMLNAQEAADFLGAHVETVRRLARKGEIPAFKLGKDWRFWRKALHRWIDMRQLRHQAPSLLIVEDEALSRRQLKTYLDSQGFRTLVASNGTEALAIVHSEPVDMVLLDLQMPVMNGPQFLGELRKSDEDMPVIILTGFPDSELMTQAMRFGPFTLLAKPFQNKPLLRAIHAGLDGARVAQSRNKGDAFDEQRERHYSPTVASRS